MNHFNLKTLIVVVCVVFGLAACDQSPSQIKQTPVPSKIIKERQAQLTTGQKADAPTTKELLDYYSANLKEAKLMWQQCLTHGLENVTDEEKPLCVAAENAWQNQPYKPDAGVSK